MNTHCTGHGMMPFDLRLRYSVQIKDTYSRTSPMFNFHTIVYAWKFTTPELLLLYLVLYIVPGQVAS